MFDAIGFEREASNGLQRVETALALTMGDLAGRDVPQLFFFRLLDWQIGGGLSAWGHFEPEPSAQAAISWPDWPVS